MHRIVGIVPELARDEPDDDPNRDLDYLVRMVPQYEDSGGATTFVRDAQRPIEWSIRDAAPGGHEGLRIEFPFAKRLSRREAIEFVAEAIGSDVRWLRPRRGRWQISLDHLRSWLEMRGRAGFLDGLDWIDGSVELTPRLEHWRPDYEEGQVITAQSMTGVYVLHFTVFREEYRLEHATQIFLSHAGADKHVVRRFAEALRTLGLRPWFDEDAMPAGTELHRGILEGFRRSCAAVFFITSSFDDDLYLRDEVNFAREEKIQKGDSFAIVTLVLHGDQGPRPVVPELLKSYVWKEPTDELAALGEIIRSLPIELGPPSWRT